MSLQYDAITTSPLYAHDKKVVDATGKSKSKAIWLLVALFVLIPILWIPGIIYILLNIPKAKKQHITRQTALGEFARQNAFTYHPVPFVQVTNGNIPGIELPLPFRAKQVTNSGYMTGAFHNLPFDYAAAHLNLLDEQGRTLMTQTSRDDRNSHFTDGQRTHLSRGMENDRGPNSTPVTRELTALTLTLPVDLPKLFLDSKRNNLWGIETRANAINNLQEYNLEGDFPQHYRVFAEKDDQINVLSILAPEVMQELLTHEQYDVWINGNKLVIFSLSTFDYFAGLPAIFSTAEMLLNEVDKIARSLRRQAYNAPAPNVAPNAGRTNAVVGTISAP